MLKRMLAALLLCCAMGAAAPSAIAAPAPNASARTAPTPAYYLLRGKYVDEIAVDCFQEALAEAAGGTLIVDGGTVTLKGNVAAKGKIVLNNATMEFQAGKYEFQESPNLFGSSSIIFTHGAQFYEKKSGSKMVVGRAGDNCYLGLEKGAMYSEVGIEKKNPALRISAPLLMEQSLKDYSAARRYMYYGGIQIKNTTFATVTGSLLHIGRGATVTIDKSSTLYLMGATVINEGKIENKGRLLLYREVLAPASAARLGGYEFYQYTGGSNIGATFENKGVLTSSGIMQIMRGASLTNAGIFYAADLLNAGILRNAGHIEHAKVLGNAFLSQHASKEHIVALQQKDAPEFTYTTYFTVEKWNTLSELALPGRTRIFKDPAGTRQWNPKKDAVTEDIILYIGE